jgi:hypothetical protein
VAVVVGLGGRVDVAGSTLGALPGQTSAGNIDVFVRKYTAEGVEAWTRQFGTPEDDIALGVGVGGPGRVYVSGTTRGKLGQEQFGGLDAFVRKYQPDGTLSWTDQFGTSGIDQAWGVGTDGDSAIYVAGGVAGALPGQTSSGGLSDAFVRKYANGGKLLWTRQFGTPGADEAFAVAVDNRGGVYVVGLTDGELLPPQPSAGGFDAFVRKYSGKGILRWTHQFGTPEHDEANGVSPNRPPRTVFVSGSTGGTLPEQTSAGGFDAFLVEISQDDVGED